MALLDSLMAGASRRNVPSGLANPQSWLTAVFGLAGESYSGKTVTVDNALSLIPVYSAVSQIAADVSATPLLVYERLDRGKRRAPQHRSYDLLHRKANDLHAADELIELLVAFLCTWGNAFAVKDRGPDGLVRKLWPLNPKRVTLDTKGTRQFPLRYFIDGAGPYFADDILHVRGLSSDGVVGYSPIQLARQALGNAMAQEEFQGRFWVNNARPGGILTTDKELSERAAKRLQRKFDSEHGGLVNAAKTAVLEEGLKWQAVGLPLADAQFIEQAKMTRTDVSLLFKLPPHKLAADTGGSLTYATKEAESIDYVMWTLRRWFVRLEKAFTTDPDIIGQPSKHFVEFLVDGILRGDSNARSQVYARGWQKWLTTNDIREAEGKNPLPGDEHDTVNPALAAKAPAGDSEQGGKDK